MVKSVVGAVAAVMLAAWAGSANAALVEYVPGAEVYKVYTVDQFDDVAEGPAEVGNYTYVERNLLGPGQDYHDVIPLQGYAAVGFYLDAYDPDDHDPADVVPIGTQFLTFEVARAGGTYASTTASGSDYIIGNIDQPFTGDITLSYAFSNNERALSGTTTFGTLSMSPTVLVGHTYSFNIDSLINQAAFVERKFNIVFKLSAGAHPVNTAWTFDNFRLTSTDQTTPAPTTAVPEPAMWAMMIFGFGIVGSSLRRAGFRRAVRSAA